jgi:hypothetical protein
MPRKSLKRRRENILNNSKNRIAPIMEVLIGIEDPDDLMEEILGVLTDVSPVPEVGKYYTFVYKPKTENVQYDAHPLVAVTDIFQWGFRGINFHWGSPRQYTWIELVGNLHLVLPEELEDLRTLPFVKVKIN